MATCPADKPRLDIGQPGIIGPALSPTDGNRMAAAIVGAVHQQPAHPHFAHFGERDFGRALRHPVELELGRPRVRRYLSAKLPSRLRRGGAAFSAVHLRLPPVRRCRLDALDLIFCTAVWTPERFSHGWIITRARSPCRAILVWKSVVRSWSRPTPPDMLSLMRLPRRANSFHHHKEIFSDCPTPRRERVP